MVGKQGLEPRPPGPRPGALTLTPHPGRDSWIRTSDLAAPDRAPYPSWAISRWRCSESNRVVNACRARPLPQLLIPRCREDGASRLLVLTLWTCQPAGTFTPQGGARRDGRLRTLYLRFWRPALYQMSYIPMKLCSNEKPPAGVCPLRAASGSVLSSYPEASGNRLVPGCEDGRMACASSRLLGICHVFTRSMVRADTAAGQRSFASLTLPVAAGR
jgi:hypothetical protein